MRREVDLKEISDGKLYRSSDMVKADCRDCEGCHACCMGMGDSIVLDPLDLHRLRTGLGLDFDQLLGLGKITLHVADSVILPNLSMAEGRNACSFLNEQGRCSIHPYRPGLCRLFPLGRYYEGDGFFYFLQVKECKKENRSKVKVQKWIDTPDVKRYEAYILSWHFFLKEAESAVLAAGNEETARKISLLILNLFYRTLYDPKQDFYKQFALRLAEGKDCIKSSK